jgi:hypothetical protein
MISLELLWLVDGLERLRRSGKAFAMSFCVGEMNWA